MKKFLLYLIFAIIGVVLAFGSSANEGWSVGGAWVGVVYAVVVAAFVAIVDNQAFDLGWKPIGKHMATIIGGAILGALFLTLF